MFRQHERLYFRHLSDKQTIHALRAKVFSFREAVRVLCVSIPTKKESTDKLRETINDAIEESMKEDFKGGKEASRKKHKAALVKFSNYCLFRESLPNVRLLTSYLGSTVKSATYRTKLKNAMGKFINRNNWDSSDYTKIVTGKHLKKEVEVMSSKLVHRIIS